MKIKPKHILWEQNVSLAKNMVALKVTNQMEIAKLALQVCEITWGGRNNRYAKEAYTLTRFAKEIGINKKTLSSWVAIRRSIYEKCDPVQRQKARYQDFFVIATEMGIGASKKDLDIALERQLSGNTYDRKIRFYIKYLKAIRWNFQKSSAKERLEPETLQELKFYCRSILSYLNGVQPADHGFSNVYSNSRKFSSARAVVGGDLRSKRAKQVKANGAV